MHATCPLSQDAGLVRQPRQDSDLHVTVSNPKFFRHHYRTALGLFAMLAQSVCGSSEHQIARFRGKRYVHVRKHSLEEQRICFYVLRIHVCACIRNKYSIRMVSLQYQYGTVLE